RDLEATAERWAVDRGDRDERKLGEIVQHALHRAARLLDIALRCADAQEGKIRARNELPLLAARDDEAARRCAAGRGDRGGEVFHEAHVDGVHRISRTVDDDPRHARVVRGDEGDRRSAVRRDGRHLCGGRRCDHAARSRMIAAPLPPAAHAVARPYRAPRRFISRASVSTMRAPVAPKGWPSAMEPPMTFSFSTGTRPTPLRSRTTSVESTCAAKASCISNTSMSSSVMPARRSAIGIAYAGAMRSWSAGSTAA